MTTTKRAKKNNPNPNPSHASAIRSKTLARLKQLKAEGLVFKSYDGISEPEYTVFDTRGGLKQRGTFGRS